MLKLQRASTLSRGAYMAWINTWQSCIILLHAKAFLCISGNGLGVCCYCSCRRGRRRCCLAPVAVVDAAVAIGISGDSEASTLLPFIMFGTTIAICMPTSARSLPRSSPEHRCAAIQDIHEFLQHARFSRWWGSRITCIMPTSKTASGDGAPTTFMWCC